MIEAFRVVLNELQEAQTRIGREVTLRELAQDELTILKEKPINHGDATMLLDYIAIGQKIHAIKEYRALTGDSLKESKDAVERVMDRMNAPSTTPTY